MFQHVKAFLLSLNTHLVGGVGLGTGVVSIGALLAQAPVDSFLSDHGAHALVPVVDYYAANLAAPLLATGLGLAYFGKPRTVSHAGDTPAPTKVD